MSRPKIFPHVLLRIALRVILQEDDSYSGLLALELPNHWPCFRYLGLTIPEQQSAMTHIIGNENFQFHRLIAIAVWALVQIFIAFSRLGDRDQH